VKDMLQEAHKLMQKTKRLVSPRDYHYAEKMLNQFSKGFETEYTDSFSSKVETKEEPIYQGKIRVKTTGTSNFRIKIEPEPKESEETTGFYEATQKYLRKHVEKKGVQTPKYMDKHPIVANRQSTNYSEAPISVYRGNMFSSPQTAFNSLPTFKKIAAGKVKSAIHSRKEKRHYPHIQSLDQTVQVFHPLLYQDDE
jgi:hypothetical protein